MVNNQKGYYTGGDSLKITDLNPVIVTSQKVIALYDGFKNIAQISCEMRFRSSKDGTSKV